MTRPLRAAVLVALLAAPALAGCVLPTPWSSGGNDGGDGDWWGDVPRATPDAGRGDVRVTFGGRVVDALSGDGVDDAQVRLDLASVAPCRRESLLWRDWALPVDADGRFGPFEQPAPDSPSYRFFVHARAAGYSDEVVYIGPAEAAAARNLTITLHPRTHVEGASPPGTVVALEAPGFPRLLVVNDSGAFRFEDARVDPTHVVVATSIPHAEAITPPARVDAPPVNGTGWSLQGVVKREDGRPIAAEVVAWDGARLVSAALTDEVGRFLLPLRAEPAALRIEARTSDDHYGGTLARSLQGPPSTVETVLVRALC